MGKTVRVGIVGAGANTRERHIPHLRSIDGVELIAVCNRTRESTEAVMRAYDIPIRHEHWGGRAGSPRTPGGSKE